MNAYMNMICRCISSMIFDAFKDGLENGSTLMDCLWGELYGSINIAQINDSAITPEHADYLRQKYLWGEDI